MRAEFDLSIFESGKTQPAVASQLTTIESTLVNTYLPAPQLNQDDLELVAAAWNARPRLLDMMRGKNFFGDLIDLSITKLAEPCEQLTSEGLRGVVGNVKPDDLIGFSVAASVDSAIANSGRVQRSIWVVRRSKSTAVTNGILWRRFIGENRGNIDLEQLHKDSVKRGWQTRDSMFAGSTNRRNRLNNSDASDDNR